MDFYAILDQVIDVLRQRQREQARTALSTAIPASPRTFLYGLCRKALSVPFDDPLSVLDATGVANIDAIRGCQPLLVPVEA